MIGGSASTDLSHMSHPCPTLTVEAATAICVLHALVGTFRLSDV